MKKALYFILLIAELFVGSLLMISLWDSSLYIPIVFSVVDVLALLIWQIILLSKAVDHTAKIKIMCNIALVMLIPIAVFIITYIVVAIAFVTAFSF